MIDKNINKVLQKWIIDFNNTHGTNFILKYRKLFPGAFLELKYHIVNNCLCSKGVKISQSTNSENIKDIIFLLEQTTLKLNKIIKEGF